MREMTADLAGRLRIAEAGPELARLLTDRERAPSTRLAAIKALTLTGEGPAAEVAATAAINPGHDGLNLCLRQSRVVLTGA
jgi:HEAT repeat protein